MKKQVRFSNEQWEKLKELKTQTKDSIETILNNTVRTFIRTNPNKVFDKLIIDLPLTASKLIEVHDDTKKLITKAGMKSQAVRKSQGLKPFVSDEEIILQCIFN